MNRLGETLLDMAIDIGYRMRQDNLVCAVDSREVMERIYDTAVTFELTGNDEDYFDAVDVATTALYDELKAEGMIASNGAEKPEPELYANYYHSGLVSTHKNREAAIAAASEAAAEIAVPLCRGDRL